MAFCSRFYRSDSHRRGKLARAGDIELAVEKFNEALSLDPELELDPESYARQLAAPALVTQWEQLARDGDIEEAIAKYEKAQEFDSKIEISADSWNELCWWGSLCKPYPLLIIFYEPA
jgi:tetratricopeptide (TPR) repeat protein